MVVVEEIGVVELELEEGVEGFDGYVVDVDVFDDVVVVEVGFEVNCGEVFLEDVVVEENVVDIVGYFIVEGDVVFVIYVVIVDDDIFVGFVDFVVIMVVFGFDDDGIVVCVEVVVFDEDEV